MRMDDIVYQEKGWLRLTVRMDDIVCQEKMWRLTVRMDDIVCQEKGRWRMRMEDGCQEGWKEAVRWKKF